MTQRHHLLRRTILRAAGSAAGLAAIGSTALGAEPSRESAERTGPSLRFDNAACYANGKFDVEKGKDAVLALCKRHGYPVFPGLREKLWVSDYGKGDFTKVGLAAYFFVNNEEDRYMMLDIFLLPNQMLPEHWHVPSGANPTKREGWLVRWGLSHIVGIGEPNLGKDVVVPKSHMGGKVSVEHETVAGPGTFVKLAKVESRHWQLAGPEGAIITEVANVHTGPGVRHSDPDMDNFFRTQ
jgi:D-lyxose ketol-isomerase